MANGQNRSWTGVGIGLGVVAVGGGILWYLTRSGKASAAPFATGPLTPPPAPPADQPMGGPPPPPARPGVLTLSMNGDAITVDGKRMSPDQAVEALKAATIPVEVHLYLVNKALWQTIKDRVGKAVSDKWNIVGVVSVGGLVRSGSGGRGVYG